VSSIEQPAHHTIYNIDYLLRRFKPLRFTKMDSDLPESRTHVPSQPIIYLPTAYPVSGADLRGPRLVCRDSPKRRWLLEIVRFWTPDYVKEKLARLRVARLTNLILCIDVERNCTDEELPHPW
jgi:hypothetical protein